jgi:hypothetical protein
MRLYVAAQTLCVFGVMVMIFSTKRVNRKSRNRGKTTDSPERVGLMVSGMRHGGTIETVHVVLPLVTVSVARAVFAFRAVTDA